MPLLGGALVERWQNFWKKARGIERNDYGEDITGALNGDITWTDRLEIRIINSKGSRTCGRTLERTGGNHARSESLKLGLMGTPGVEVNKPVTH